MAECLFYILLPSGKRKIPFAYPGHAVVRQHARFRYYGGLLIPGNGDA